MIHMPPKFHPSRLNLREGLQLCHFVGGAIETSCHAQEFLPMETKWQNLAKKKNTYRNNRSLHLRCSRPPVDSGDTAPPVLRL